MNLCQDNQGNIYEYVNMQESNISDARDLLGYANVFKTGDALIMWDTSEGNIDISTLVILKPYERSNSNHNILALTPEYFNEKYMVIEIEDDDSEECCCNKPEVMRVVMEDEYNYKAFCPKCDEKLAWYNDWSSEQYKYPFCKYCGKALMPVEFGIMVANGDLN